MKKVTNIPTILKINDIQGYKVSCLFSNGESRIIDFEVFFKDLKNYSKKHPAYKLMQDKQAFDQVSIIGNTIGWKNTGIYGTDVSGKEVFYPYDLDPIVLFECSKIDEKRTLAIGLLVKQMRKELGLTKKQLAQKSDTSKYVISKIENNPTDVTLATLIKVIEGGLGKKLQFNLRII